jgi:hypothetical protein
MSIVHYPIAKITARILGRIQYVTASTYEININIHVTKNTVYISMKALLKELCYSLTSYLTTLN